MLPRITIKGPYQTMTILLLISDGVNSLKFVKFIENNTLVHIDMEFLLECSTQ